MTSERDDIGVWLPGQTLADRYRVLREVGQGAMGRVFEAQHALLGKRLAVKVLATACDDQRARARFFHEARAASTIDHQHIVSVLDFGLIPETRQPYLVMEFVDGESLEDLIQREAPFPLEQSVEIAAQLLSALAVVHGAGLVHRDIKPANIIRLRGSRSRPFIKLLDFGIAGVLDPEAWGRRPLTRVRQVVGTPAYLAPEQARGEEVSPQWDLWAATIVSYEMVSGKLPFPLESLRQIQEDIAHHRLIPLERMCPDLPPWLLAILGRALAQRASDRFASATAYLQALEQRALRPPDQDDRTTPFLRVQLATPPPELLRPPSSREDPTQASGPRRALKEPSSRGFQGATDLSKPEDQWQPPTAPTVAGLRRPGRVSGSVSLAEPTVTEAEVAREVDADDEATRAIPRISAAELGPLRMPEPHPRAPLPLLDPPRPAPAVPPAAAEDRNEDDQLRTVAVRRTDARSLRSGEIPLRSPTGQRRTGQAPRPWVVLLLGGVILLVSAVAVAVWMAR